MRRHYRNRMEDRVDFHGDTAFFSGKLGPRVQRYFLSFTNHVRRQRLGHVVLDFTDCTKAYPNSMIPMIADVQELIGEGVRVDCILPRESHLHRLFCESNWAHYLSCGRYSCSDDVSNRHLVVRQFNDGDAQQQIVNEFLDITMRALQLERPLLGALEWTINEITDNVLNHSNSKNGGFVQLNIYPQNQRIAFCVADAGCGILQSLREAYPNLQSDHAALGQAVRAGITRNKDIGQGNGLSGSLKIAISTEGAFRIASGSAELRWNRDQPDSSDFDSHKAFHGTIVDVQMSTAKKIDLGAVLSAGTTVPSYQPTDFIETQYLSDDGKLLTVAMGKETFGFGSRRAGAQMRMKALNLLNAEVAARLLIDWDGIPMISSSYADEFIGKLFVSLGPMAFMNRVSQTNAIPVIRQLIDRAIMQRTSQTLSAR
jgi:anti-sigma regulatory factor (Ser/Thr protein kinase)